MSTNKKPGKPTFNSVLNSAAPKPTVLRVCFSWVFGFDATKNDKIRRVSKRQIETAKGFFAQRNFTLDTCPKDITDSEIDRCSCKWQDPIVMPARDGNDIRHKHGSKHPDSTCALRLPVMFCPMDEKDVFGTTFMGRSFFADCKRKDSAGKKRLIDDEHAKQDLESGWGTWALSYAMINAIKITPDHLTIAHEMMHAAGYSGHQFFGLNDCAKVKALDFIPVPTQLAREVPSGCFKDCDLDKRLAECATCADPCPKQNSIARVMIKHLCNLFPPNEKQDIPGPGCYFSAAK